MISLHKSLELLLLIAIANALEYNEGSRFIRQTLRFPSKNFKTMSLVKNNNAEEIFFSSPDSDLLPLAQSYFITPETPSTTTVKPTFMRRQTSIINSLSKNHKSFNEDVDISSSTTSAYNPFRQIMDTGFQHKRQIVQQHQYQQKRPSSSILMMRREYHNLNEASGGVSSNESNNDKKEQVVVKNEEQGNAKYGRRRINNKAALGPSSDTGIPSGTELPSRPHRFSQQMRSFSRKNENESNGGSSSPSTTAAPPVQASTGGRGFSRNGRQFGTAKRKTIDETTERQQVKVEGAPPSENQPFRRRRKFKPSTTTSTENNDNASSPALQKENEPKRINPNVYANRRAVARKLSTDNSPTLNPVESVQDSIPPLNRRNRHRTRPVDKSLFIPLDSEQQSSDTVTILAESPEDTKSKAESTDSVDSKSQNENSDAPLPYSPRNLSNRRQPSNNALSKVNTNRQAAARRFLTPKKSEGEEVTSFQPTTKAPPASTTPRAPRKSPLSLANLRNRRLGNNSPATTSTTEAPLSNEEQGNFEGALKQSGAEVENGTVSIVVINLVTNGTESFTSTEENAAPVEEKPVEEKSPLSGLLRNRRPQIRLPGSRAVTGGGASPPRAPILKPKTTEATTPKPNVETTTQPTCEDGKRYNKVLRKCIPTFVNRNG